MSEKAENHFFNAALVFGVVTAMAMSWLSYGRVSKAQREVYSDLRLYYEETSKRIESLDSKLRQVIEGEERDSNGSIERKLDEGFGGFY